MAYNLTKVSNFNTTAQMLQNVNTELMSGVLGMLILVAICVILYMAFVFATRQPVKSFTGVAFIGSMLAMLLFIMELVPLVAVWILLIGCGVSIAFWNLE